LLDQALTQRKRSSTLSRLGEQVYSLAQRGQLGELLLEPEIALLIGELEQLDSPNRRDDEHDHGFEAVSSADYAASRHGREGEPGSGSSAAKEYRVWRPVMPEDAEILDDTRDESAPERPARLSRSRSAERRGGGIHFGAPSPSAEDPDSDDDLASYMHDDDVPNE